MSTNDKCFKCGCADIIQGAAVESPCTGGGWYGLEVRVDAHPKALVFHKAVRSGMSVRVCLGCGYVEFYATDTESLRKAFREARESG